MSTLSRRQFIETGAFTGVTALGALGVARWLAGCSTTAAPLSVLPSAGAAAVAGTGANGSPTKYATGGTANMLASYPDPFTSATSQACVVTTALTVGPCYAQTLMRQDVSEGLTGLPVRLALKVVYADSCEPVKGATVDIWHTNAAGYYSAYAKGSMCNPNDADATTKHFMRGVQTTDANGRVDFNTVFPGWYASRTVHIHFTVRIGDTEEVTSQLFFDDALTDDVYANHIDYNSRTKRDTNNTNDTVLPHDNQGAFVLTTARMTDGVLQASKVIAIKSA